MTKRRLTKRELKGDAFLEASKRFILYLRQNPKRVKWTAIVILVVFCGIISVRAFIKGRENEAFFDFSHALSLYKKAEEHDTSGDQEKMRKVLNDAIQEFKKVEANYGVKKYDSLSLFYAAQSYMKIGKYKEAKEVFRSFLRRFPRHALSPVVLRELALLYEEDGKYADAIQVYQRVVEDFPKTLPAGFAQVSIGRCLLELKRPKEARDAFRKSIENYSDSIWVDEARFGLVLARAEMTKKTGEKAGEASKEDKEGERLDSRKQPDISSK
jgi:tetratricopeptide (TPR) repeat protein